MCERLDVAGVADYVAASTVTISADRSNGVSFGTGVIITSDGEIVTNAHVVEGSSEVRVRLSGESEPREATVLAEDRGNDLALLRISGEGYQAAIEGAGFETVGEEAVPDWDNAEGGVIFEQLLTAAGGDVDGVLVANDGLSLAAQAVPPQIRDPPLTMVNL